MGIFINDRVWNIKQAKINYEWAEWHTKRAVEAARRNDKTAEKDHLYSAQMYKAKGDEYMRSASKSTK